jgi:hypothetical protein
MDKPKMQSSQSRRRKLRRAFCDVPERCHENGAVVRTIDKDMLTQQEEGEYS